MDKIQRLKCKPFSSAKSLMLSTAHSSVVSMLSYDDYFHLQRKTWYIEGITFKILYGCIYIQPSGRVIPSALISQRQTESCKFARDIGGNDRIETRPIYFTLLGP